MAISLVSLLLVLVSQSVLLAPRGVLGSVMNITALFAFGDSTIDPGNNNWIDTIVRANFTPYGVDFPGAKATGRFGNGRTGADILSEILELKPIVPAYLDPSQTLEELKTGANFASAGSGYDDSTAAILGVLSVPHQINNFIKLKRQIESEYGLEEAQHIIKEAVYYFSCGTNDWVENYFLFHRQSRGRTIDQYIEYLVKRVEKMFRKLYSLGARYLVQVGITPMGCMPLERTISKTLLRRCKEEYNEVAKKYNGKLDQMFKKLNATFQNSIVIFANPYDLVHSMYTAPWQHGFEVVDRGCVGTGLYEMSSFCEDKRVCRDRSKYFFFDSFHPTERANELIVKHLYKEYFPKFDD